MTDDFDERHIRNRSPEHDPVTLRWVIAGLAALWAGMIGLIVWVAG